MSFYVETCLVMNGVSDYYGSTTIVRGGNKIASCFNAGFKVNFEGILI
jgi:hypothetical protein